MGPNIVQERQQASSQSALLRSKKYSQGFNYFDSLKYLALNPSATLAFHQLHIAQGSYEELVSQY